jgi:hypothetical protein
VERQGQVALLLLQAETQYLAALLVMVAAMAHQWVYLLLLVMEVRAEVVMDKH